jgi:outer membrane protein assembly factor BamB
LDHVWSSAAVDEPRALAADASGVVAIGDGAVVALDLNGGEQWRVDMDDARLRDPLALGAGVVALSVGGAQVVALDRASGARRWEVAVADIEALGIGLGSDGRERVLVVTRTGALTVLDAANGVASWVAAFGADGEVVRARAFVSTDRVLVAWTDQAGAHLRAFGVSDGALVWGDEAPNLFSMPVVDAERVFFAANERLDRKQRAIARVRSLAVADGTELWSRRVRGRFGYWSGTLTAANEEVVSLVDLNGKVTVLDATTGEVWWRRATGQRQLEAEPHVLGTVVAMSTYGTGVAALSAASGAAVMPEDVEAGSTAMTIQATAAAGHRLYLLVEWPWGDPEVWMLQAGPA